MSSLEENNHAPEIELSLDDGKIVALQQFSGKNIVLYFYPKDDTPGCTTEAKDFASLTPKFTNLNTVIIGISKDNAASHKKFKDKYCIPFPLASDLDGKICEAYGVWVEKSMYGKKYMGIQRSTFIIDKKGSIKRIWRNVSVTNHAQEVLETIENLQ
ncbi:MAG: thioredoxin-dependent thiol peroxidase [Alphaproteobacteria bacterium]|jgi:peroxiredoxin Q/BCP